MSIKLYEKLPKFKNRVRATLKNAMTGEVVSTVEVPNLIVDSGKALLLDALGGDNTKYLTHVAAGHSGGIASAGTVLLVSEMERVPVTYSRNAQVGTFYGFANTASMNSGAITEIGFFGGANANMSANTGTLFNRILISSTYWAHSNEIMLWQKTANYKMDVDLDVKF